VHPVIVLGAAEARPALVAENLLFLGRIAAIEVSVRRSSFLGSLR